MFIVEKEPKSIIAETYRTLRTNIQYSSFDNEYKTILITSAQMGEGKSTTAGNLALAFSQGDSKVLLIDCDMRKPTVHKKFKISNKVGLSELLIGDSKLDEIAYSHNKNLDILTSGKVPPNPSEMLGSKAMKDFLTEAATHYDYVILDAPPIIPVTDAQVLATKVDGVVLVIRAENTKKESVSNSIKLITRVKGKIIGTVLNGIDNKKRNQYYYYYGEK